MNRVLLASCLLSAAMPAFAQAAPAVYPGCAVPSVKPGRHTFFVDPVKGSPSGDGSMLKPWRTLAEVVTGGKISTMSHAKPGGVDPLAASNPNGPVKAGDAIMLMSGDHGDVTIMNAFNKDFVTVMSAPGQTPSMRSLVVNSSSNWMFQGIKFGTIEGGVAGDISKRPSTPIAAVSRSDYFGTSSNFVFDNNIFSSADNTGDWTSDDWFRKTKFYAVSANTKCFSFTNNQVKNVLNGLVTFAESSLIQSNTFSTFANDAIELAASNVTIRGNVIRDGTNVSSSPWHPDGIQGWSVTKNGVLATNSNILIENNMISKFGDPNKSGMQGISIYDGKWNNLSILNNVVIVNLWNAIAVSGAQNAKIMNNTVYTSEPVKHQSWISVSKSSQGVQSSNVIVRNNISPSLTMPSSGVTFDHNAVGGTYTVFNGTKPTYFKTSDSSKSIIMVPSLASQFVMVNPGKDEYDLRLKPASPLRGMGSAALMPLADISGRIRSAPVLLGAYAQ